MRLAGFSIVAVTSLLFAPGALAADLPVKAPPVVHATAVNWTGFYVGGGIGGRWARSAFQHYELGAGPVGNPDNRESFAPEPSGFAGGVHLGAQYQFGTWLLGVEGSWIGGKHSDRQRTTLSTPFAAPPTARFREATIEDAWLVAGRLGYAWNQWLVYGKAGYANVQIGFDNICDQAAGCFGVALGQSLGSSEQRADGFLLGAGAEYRVHRNFSLGLDYTYLHAEGENQRAVRNGVVSACCGNDQIKVDVHTVLLRGSVHF